MDREEEKSAIMEELERLRQHRKAAYPSIQNAIDRRIRELEARLRKLK